MNKNGERRSSGMPWDGYDEASKRFSPSAVSLLFVAEAPPSSRERYFYFPEVRAHDDLWIALMKALYPQNFGETRKERLRKHAWLTKFQRDGYKLIDVLKEPVPEESKPRVRHLLRGQVDALVAEIRKIRPRQVLLIKATVYDELYKPLKEARLPVVDGRLPFPGSGKQGKFLDGFRNLVGEGKLAL